jgi:PilZ domain-containing protein
MIKKTKAQASTATLERRREPRTKASHSVLLRIRNARPIEAWVLDVSSTGVRLRVPEAAPVGAAVTIEAQDLLLIGTIIRCELTREAYELGIVLTRPLELLGELQKLYTALWAESGPIGSSAWTHG